MNRFLLTVFVCVSWMPLAFSAGPWNYDDKGAIGPSHWGGICESGKKQSPIDIKSADATLDEDLGSFTLKNYDTTPTNGTFTGKNNGHSLSFVFPENSNYSVSGGGLVGKYRTHHFHLHWGSVNTQGSEHNLDGKKFAAELHFVSYNTKYSKLSKAVPQPDGLAVLGVFIEVEGNKNVAFSFLENAKSLIDAGSSKSDIPAFKLNPILPSDQTKYFRYSGSLTTPGCNESVTWTVFNEAVKISQDQMDLLRSLKANANASMDNNYRPVQQLNDRVVMASFQVPKPSTPPPSGASAVNMAAALFSLMLFVALIGH